MSEHFLQASIGHELMNMKLYGQSSPVYPSHQILYVFASGLLLFNVAQGDQINNENGSCKEIWRKGYRSRIYCHDTALKMYNHIAKNTAFSGRFQSMLAMILVSLAAMVKYQDIPLKRGRGFALTIL